MTAADGPIRQDTRSLMVTVFRPSDDRTPIIKGIWDKKTGGAIDSDETKYYPGAMADPVSLGGRKTVENLTLSRLCRIQRDWEAIPSLIAAVGKAKVTVADQAMDIDGNATGVSAIVYNGTLKRVSPPDADSEASGPAMIEIEVTIDGFPASS